MDRNYEIESHSSRKEGGITEDVKYIFGSGYEECFSLFDANAVDVRFSPKTYDHYEGVGMEIDFRCYLYNDAVDGKVRTVDELGVRFG